MPGGLGLVARRDRAVARVAVLRPRAGIEAALAEAGVLEWEQVVAGGDARAAGGDDLRGVLDARVGVDAAQRLDGDEAAALPDVLARRHAARAGDVTRARVQRLDVAAVAVVVARVEDEVGGVRGVVD